MQCLGLLAILVLPFTAQAQFEPETAHVNLYFPQLADGGTPAQSWQTSFVFVNANPVYTASVVLTLYSSGGQPLNLDLGSGARSSLSFSIPPRGSRILRSRAASTSTVTGWAIANASIPIQGTVLFRAIQNGVPQVELSSAATLPSPTYRSLANRQLGIAVANIYTNFTVSLNIAAFDSEGRSIAETTIRLPSLNHRSFSLSSVLPSLPTNFTGSIEINGEDTSHSFVAWTLNSDGGLLSTLPPGTLSWPISHWDRIWLVYNKVFAAAQAILVPNGINLAERPIKLDISPERVINAFADSSDRVQINLALSELISDSPSELAFIIGHELGHIVQFRLGRLVLVTDNQELDADQMGLLFSLVAGFDPYAGAGALAKMEMASNRADLVSQAFLDHYEVHRSLNTRIAGMFNMLVEICSDPEYSGYCGLYKSLIHPHFPGVAPLRAPAQPSTERTKQ